MSGDLRLFLSPTQSIRGDEQQTARKSHTMSVARMSKMPFEVNNNSPELFQASFKRNRNESVVSVSSASSCHSDSSEDVEGLSRKSSTAQELTQKDNAVEVRRLHLRRVSPLSGIFSAFVRRNCGGWAMLSCFNNNFALLLSHCV